MTPRSREWLLRLAVAFGSFIFSLIFLEVVVRMIEPKETMRYFFVEPDSVLHHKFIPNARGHYVTVEFNTSYTINSLGLHDYEFPVEKPPNTFRILMVGDSFTEGEGVEANETFSKVLERILRGKSSTVNYQVINAGCGSYSPLLEYLYLKNAGLKLAPDLVVLFYDLSDVYDDIQYTRIGRFDSTGIPIGVSPTPGNRSENWLGRQLIGLKDFFKDHTRLYNFVRLRIGRYIEGSGHKGIELGNIQYDKYAMLRENYTPANDSDWSLSYKYILLIRDMLKANGIDFWVVVYPYGLQVGTREFVEGRQYWGFKTDTVYSTKPQGFMEAFCRRNGVQAVNICEDFKSLSQTVYPTYFDFNGHWTARGHELVAELLDRKLTPYLQSRFTTSGLQATSTPK
jgi:hypothetical protein